MTDRLLDYFRERANHRGLFIVRAAVLEETLRCSYEALEPAVRALSDAGRIRILSPLPYLTVALLPRPWSASRSPSMKKVHQISTSERSIQDEVPVSSAAAAATQQREVGGAGEGEALLDTVLAVLGPEAERDEFALILAGQPAELVRRCLRRVQATKAIRVSKAALFRSLLAKL